MIKWLIILLLLTGKVYAQPSPTIDTLCFPVPVIKKVLVAAEEAKILKEQVSILNERIAGLELIVKELKDKDFKTVATYEAQIQVLKDQKKIYDNALDELNKAMRKEKRKRFFTALAGLFTTGAAIFLSK